MNSSFQAIRPPPAGHAPAPDAAVFEARGLTKVYQMGEVKIQALRGVDLDLFPGEFVVLLGPSGSGKSTLLNILGGLDVPTSGKVRFRDHDLTAYDDAALTHYRREHVGFVWESYYERNRFAHIFTHLKRAPNSLLARITEIPGVAAVQARVVVNVTLDVPGLAEPAVGRIVSIPDRPGHELNALHLRRGQCTVITSEFGRRKGLRIVRGREDECEEYYRQGDELRPGPLHKKIL